MTDGTAHLVVKLEQADFEWGDLSADDEAARFAAKCRILYGGNVPPGAKLHHYRGCWFDIVRHPTDGRWGVRNRETGRETWPPHGVEGPTRPELTRNTVREVCGIVALEARVAELEAQLKDLKREASISSAMEDLDGLIEDGA